MQNGALESAGSSLEPDTRKKMGRPFGQANFAKLRKSKTNRKYRSISYSLDNVISDAWSL